MWYTYSMNEAGKKNRIYAAIDLKSFFASVECVQRGLDPLGVNLVVADSSRTEKTICLAVSPALKAYGIPGRARLFEVVRKVRDVNRQRRKNAPNGTFKGKSFVDEELKNDPALEVGYIVAVPRMGKYVETSRKIYEMYKQYVSEDDIIVYSIDEVFIDLTDYLKIYKLTARGLVMKMIKHILSETGITATAGIGTNLYLCKIAMDVEAKKIPPDENGVRIAELDEISYRKKLWDHKPITDFWRVGAGYAERLAAQGLRTMGDIARCSLGSQSDYYNEELLFKIFGVNAELLIDHAWGYEPCTIKDVKAYKPSVNSLSSGQVLQEPYPFEKARLIVKEMADFLAMDLFEKRLVTNQIVIDIVYDAENLSRPEINYNGEVKEDRYGRKMPAAAHGSHNLGKFTSSTAVLVEEFDKLFLKTANHDLLVRKLNLCASFTLDEKTAAENRAAEQISFFDDASATASEEEKTAKERKRQEAVLEIRKKYGKNAMLKGMNFEQGATGKSRNKQIGGHRE